MDNKEIKRDIIKYYNKYEFNKFFNCDDIKRAFKATNSGRIELNFAKHLSNYDGEKHVYKNIYLMQFTKNSIYIGNPRSYMSSERFINLLEIIFNCDNFECDRSGIYIKIDNECGYEDCFKKLKKLFDLLINIKTKYLLLDNNKRSLNSRKGYKEGKIIEGKFIKNKYTIDMIQLSNGIFALDISYGKENGNTNFIKEINKLRSLDQVYAHNGNTIQFNKEVKKHDIIKLLKQYGWDLDEEKQNNSFIENDYENFNQNIINESEDEEDYLILIQSILNSNTKKENLKRATLSKILREWTERNGKYVGCKIWSRKALNLYNKYNRKISKISSSLIHEHIIPVNVIVDNLLSLSNNDLVSIKEILDKSKAAVITKKEDQSIDTKLAKNMPNELSSKLILEYSDKEIFSRYDNEAIDLKHIKWNNKNYKIIGKC